MSTLPILHYPDPRLFFKAEPITKIDKWVHELAYKMIETMYESSGIGLAATQVNVHKQLIVVDISREGDALLVLINPKITWMSQEKAVFREGCLSIPGVYENIERASKLHCKALNRNGEPLEFDADGLLSICIQHEIDHLEGKVFLDHLSRLKKNRILKKLEKLQNCRV